MTFSTEATQDLEKLLQEEFGDECYKKLSKEEIQEIGEFLLFLTSESLKIHIANRQ